MTRMAGWILGVVTGLGAAGAWAGDAGAPLTLDLAAAKIQERNATCVKRGGALDVAFAPDADWPGIVVDGRWDFSAHDELVATVRNTGAAAVRLEWRVNGPGGNWRKDSLTEKTPLAPGEEKAVVMRLLAKGAPGTPPGAGMDLSRAERMEFILPRAANPRTLILKPIKPRGPHTPPAAADPTARFPLVDRFGQFRGADWPGKVMDENELRAGAAREAEARAARPAPAA